jgi:LmbE family N-acetylglucosaminyl deacetylase
LIVVAHPDDEVLGCGGTAAVLASSGEQVRACILCGEAGARRGRPALDQLKADIDAAQERLGLQPAITGGFDNLAMNTVPHRTLVEFVERAIIETASDVIFTHHPADLNDDHLHVSRACQAAARNAQRGGAAPPLRALFFMEVPSATDWSFAGGNSPAFVPDCFFEIEQAMDRKLSALVAYRGVMREFPHPRSEQCIRGLAAVRGGQSGMKYAEAFRSGFVALSRTWPRLSTSAGASAPAT